MYTDTDSKIEQYRRIRKFFAFFLVLEVLCLMVEFFAVIETRSPLYLGFTLLIGVICLAMLHMIWKCNWKIEDLKKQKN